MKRIFTATLLSSALLVAVGAGSAFADRGHGRDGGFRDGGFRDGGSRYEDVGHRHRNRHWRRPRCSWDKVCWRGRWGQRQCKLVRDCRRGW